jgi:hypothetical protein
MADRIDCGTMPNPEPIDVGQIERLVAAWRASKTHLADLLEAVGANTIAEMSSSQYVKAMSFLQRKRSRLEQGQAEA